MTVQTDELEFFLMPARWILLPGVRLAVSFSRDEARLMIDTEVNEGNAARGVCLNVASLVVKVLAQ